MNVGSIIASAAAACVVLGFIGKGIRGAYRWCQEVGAAIQDVKKRSATLEPNGGSSMRDAVNRIEAHLKSQDEHLAKQDVAIAKLEGRRQRRWLQ